MLVHCLLEQAKGKTIKDVQSLSDQIVIHYSDGTYSSVFAETEYDDYEMMVTSFVETPFEKPDANALNSKVCTVEEFEKYQDDREVAFIEENPSIIKIPGATWPSKHLPGGYDPETGERIV